MKRKITIVFALFVSVIFAFSQVPDGKKIIKKVQQQIKKVQTYNKLPNTKEMVTLNLPVSIVVSNEYQVYQEIVHFGYNPNGILLQEVELEKNLSTNSIDTISKDSYTINSLGKYVSSESYDFMDNSQSKTGYYYDSQNRLIKSVESELISGSWVETEVTQIDYVGDTLFITDGDLGLMKVIRTNVGDTAFIDAGLTVEGIPCTMRLKFENKPIAPENFFLEMFPISANIYEILGELHSPALGGTLPFQKVEYKYNNNGQLLSVATYAITDETMQIRKVEEMINEYTEEGRIASYYDRVANTLTRKLTYSQNNYNNDVLCQNLVDGLLGEDTEMEIFFNKQYLEPLSKNGNKCEVSYANFTVSIDEANQSTQVTTTKIYPNPAQNRVTIEAQGIQRCQIMDMAGRTVYSTYPTNKTSSLTIDISNLKNGIYFIQTSSKAGVSTKKLIKQ